MARRFGVIIQPQLIMLQKTLLNIEGLGRELDPNLDLWKSSQPFLTRWMSEQVGWRSMLKTIKKELPHIIKVLPEMPRLAHQFLTQTNQAEMDLPLRASIDKLIEAQQRQAVWQKRLVLAILAVAAVEVILVVSTYFIH
jgi:ubiquinone biosynthesis protein